ncbi:hypothetical protein [Lentzea cavernae]|uniref:PilZ domain-containing protein n=1 Tax=Lentzea cavernae TaxID=2020703 RepID=A0ABQ3ML61_9PSEU|nr:hypothetical protein [Lentzea cavernae]GHH42141.1 hypothetical protein GCM10017774_37930 [Lentzea cavernae]
MADLCVVGVPVKDRADLEGLVRKIPGSGDPFESQFFDGVAFVETVVPIVLSGAAWLTLRTWIQARAEVRKATRISYRGFEFTAVNPADAERILKVILEAEKSSIEE